MSGSLCGEGTPVGASGTYQMISTQVEIAQQYAAEAFAIATEGLDALREFTVDEVSVNTGFNVTATADLFTPPVAPAVPEDVFVDPGEPGAPPTLTAIADISVGSAPTFSETAPVISLPAKPSALSATAPSEPSPPSAPVFPDSPDDTLPSVPTMRDILLPTLGFIDIEGLRTAFENALTHLPTMPSGLIDGLAENIVADTGAMYSTIKGRLDAFLAENPAFALNRTRLGELLSGTSIGMPAAVESQLRGRAFTAEDEQAARAIDTALWTWSAKGFSQNDGVLQGRLADIYQDNRNKQASLNRDIFIQASEWEIKNLQFAVQQGIAWEGVYRQVFSTIHAAAHEMAWHLFQAAEAIFNASSKIYELQLEGFKAEMASFEEWIKVELSVLEIYKSELEGAKLIGELNLQDIEIYKARLTGVMTVVEIYKANLQAVNLKITADSQVIELYKARVQAFTALVQAKTAEWGGYGEAVKGEVARADVYDSLVKAFSERMRAYGIEADVAKSIEGFKVDQARLQIDEFRAELEWFRAKLETALARVNAQHSLFGDEMRLFEAQGNIESTRVSSDNRTFQLQLEEGKTRADLELKKAELNISQVDRAAAIEQQSLDAVARVGAQLAGASMSSVNMGASLSNGYSEGHSFGCQTSYSVDATP